MSIKQKVVFNIDYSQGVFNHMIKKNNSQTTRASRPLQSWALVTGATSGIGRATTERLAKDGYSLILLARRIEILNKLKKSLQSSYKNCEVRVFKLDISQTKEIQIWHKEQASVISKIDVLVNNAGIAKGVDKIQNANWSDFETMIDVNIKGLLALALPIIKTMATRKTGHIINLGSVAGRWVYPGASVYCATKFALRALSEAMRQDLIGCGVRVTNIEPGMVNTEFSTIRLGNKNLADKVYEKMTPLSAEDIAESIAWCLSQPKHVNIQELVIYPTDQAHVGMVHRS